MVLKLSVAKVEVLIWVLIYGGLLVFGLGLALREVHALMAGSVSIGGLAVAAVGIVLIWYRTRMLRAVPPPADDPSTPHR